MTYLVLAIGAATAGLLAGVVIGEAINRHVYRDEP